MKRENAIILLLFAGVMWSLGGLLIKSIPWPPLAISGMRGGIAAIVIYIYSRNDKITITKDTIIAACFYTLVVTLFVMDNVLMDKIQYSKSNIDQEVLSPTRNVANQMKKCEHIKDNAQSSDSLECK